MKHFTRTDDDISVSEDYNPPSPSERIEAKQNNDEIIKLGATEVRPDQVNGLTKSQMDFTCDVTKLNNISSKTDPQKLKKQGFKTKEDFEKDGYIVKEFEDRSMQTKGVLLYKKDSDEVHISFRGTKNPRNMATDANLGLTPVGFMKGQVHAGFYNAFQGLWPEVRKELDNISSKQGKDISELKYNFSGHSMGGAIAKIAAQYVNNEYSADNIKVVTFGDPRVFDTKAARQYNKELGEHTVRFTQEKNKDIVPATAPGIMGYKHVGAQIRVESPEGVIAPHNLNYYKQGVQKLDETKLEVDNSVSFFHKPVKLIQKLREAAVYKIKTPIKDKIKQAIGHKSWHEKEKENRAKDNGPSLENSELQKEAKAIWAPAAKNTTTSQKLRSNEGDKSPKDLSPKKLNKPSFKR